MARSRSRSCGRSRSRRSRSSAPCPAPCPAPCSSPCPPPCPAPCPPPCPPVCPIPGPCGPWCCFCKIYLCVIACLSVWIVWYFLDTALSIPIGIASAIACGISDLLGGSSGSCGGGGGCSNPGPIGGGCGAGASLSMSPMELINADKTGKPDFAMESLGGSIVSTENTEQYGSSGYSILGIPLCCSRNGPRAIIQPNVFPGECWQFKGSTGSVIVKLHGYVKISSVSLEHIPKAISPSGKIDSAPKRFKIYGLRDASGGEEVLLGKFTYNDCGPSIQDFPVSGCSDSFEYIKMKITSNHGNPSFTCVYRLRVHGTLDSFKCGKD